ncbi:MAG: hypothetical protein HN963_01935, partial [Thiotrichales bacterium]|nr:hypothetical protein [Thiotrichales bacterium]MBT7005677.1 hypothetical protein [Thiotrichales bacterium]
MSETKLDTISQSDSDSKDNEPLGIAGGMAKSFIHSPLSPLLLFAMLGLGFIGLMMTPRQEDP